MNAERPPLSSFPTFLDDISRARVIWCVPSQTPPFPKTINTEGLLTHLPLLIFKRHHLGEGELVPQFPKGFHLK